jgi:hypothetical protein
MRDILKKYVGQTIGINFKQPKGYEYAELVEVSDDHLSVKDPETGITFHFPLRWIMNIVESEAGLSLGTFSKKDYPVLVEVFHLVVYSGAAGVGISF